MRSAQSWGCWGLSGEGWRGGGSCPTLLASGKWAFENYLELKEILEAFSLAEPCRLPNPEDPKAQRGGRLA